MRIIVGLGNPGEQYAQTRHNIAWLYFDYLLGNVKWSENKKWSALVYEQGGCLYVRPLSFMNNSGQVVRKILDYYKLMPKKFGLLTKREADLSDVLTVIHDDLDIDFGLTKTALDSGSAGNRGVQSTIDNLKTKKFHRVRIGIKNEELRQPIPPEKFVLQKFKPDEKTQLPDIFSTINLEIIK
jgi:PTH1 family peptidyl-tRNA hydrolase